MADLPEGFDLEALLAPIPGDAPQGVDMREDFSAPRHITGCATRAPRRATPSAARTRGDTRMQRGDPRPAAVAHGARARR